MYMKKFVDGGPAQQVTQFQPTFSPAQQGLGSMQQAPDTPAMESTPQDYYSQYAPTQQYNAPAASPMTAGLGSYMEGLQYKAPPPSSLNKIPAGQDLLAALTTLHGDQSPKKYTPSAGGNAPGTIMVGGRSWTESDGGKWYANDGELGYFDKNFIDTLPASSKNVTPLAPTEYVPRPVGTDITKIGSTSTPAAAPSTTTTYNPQTQQYTAPTAPVEPAAATPAVNYGTPGYAEGIDYNNPGGAAGGHVNGSTIGYAQGGSIPQGIASLGRGQDSMLVHMTPGEVQGLQKLAMAHGGSLTINPQTGLPEAGFLSSILPMIAGAALAPMTAGTSLAFLGTPMGAALTVGGLSALTSGSLKKGLMAGLGAYGGAGLGGSLAEMGTEQANKLVSSELAGNQVGATTGNASADAALRFAEANKEEAIQRAVNRVNLADRMGEFGTGDSYMGDSAYRAELSKNPIDNRLLYNTTRPTDFATNPFTKESVGYMQGQGSTGADIAQLARESAANASPMPTYSPATQEALARSPKGNMLSGVQQLGTKEGLKNLGGKLGYAGVAGLAAPLLSSALTPNKFVPPEKTPTQYYKADYQPPKFNELTGTYDPASYGPGSYYTNPTQYAAEGGAVGYATGDLVAKPYRGGPGENPENSRDMYSNAGGINNNKTGRGVAGDDIGAGINQNTPSGVEGLFANTSATTLARYKKAKNAAKQAAAVAEINKRANAVDDFGADTTSAAQGGLMGTYAAGGRLLRGDGDGMSDSIPAVIQGAKPQRAALADGEFVIPADVVSHLGNGSTEAGSKRLYSMMNKVRKARTGNSKQGKQINPERFMPA